MFKNLSLKQWNDKTNTVILFSLLNFLFLAIFQPLNYGLNSIDSWDFFSLISNLNIAHPPGYSIFLTTSYTLTKLLCFFGISAQEAPSIVIYCFGIINLNLFIIYLKMQKFSYSLILGISVLFLQASAIQFTILHLEVYCFNIFLFLLFLIFLNKKKHIHWTCFIAASLVTHHTTMVLICFILIAPQYQAIKKNLFKCLIFTLLPFIFHILFLVVAGAVDLKNLNIWGDMTDPIVLFNHFSAKVFHPLLGAPTTKSFTNNLEVLKGLFPSWTLLLIFTIPLIKFKKQTLIQKQFIAILLLHLIQNLCYKIPDIHSYYTIPTILILIIASNFFHPFSKYFRYLFCSVSIFSLIFYPKLNLLHDESYLLGREIIENAEVIQKSFQSPHILSITFANIPLTYGQVSENKYKNIHLIQYWMFQEKYLYNWNKNKIIKVFPNIKFAQYLKKVNAIHRAKQFIQLNYSSIDLFYSSFLEKPNKIKNRIIQVPYLNYGLFNKADPKGVIDNPIHTVMFTNEINYEYIHSRQYYKNSTIWALIFLNYPNTQSNLYMIIKSKQKIIKIPIQANKNKEFKIMIPKFFTHYNSINISIYSNNTLLSTNDLKLRKL
ncbi:MAG: hypothetical protein COB02_01160 [Candidatus Cloacimonadota bacterium]|nr:MAG: hypothetical protein COB02_01160 [Candidatus Cloacimonadota bacterium]